MADPFTDPTPATPSGSLTFADLLDRFDVVEDDGNGYAVLCPSHEDTKPSLRVAYNADRKTAVLKCRVGCRTGDVVAALGLKMADLFNVEPGDLANVRSAGAVPEPVSIAHRAALAMYLGKAAAQYVPWDGTLQPQEATEVSRYAFERFGITSERAHELGLGYDAGDLSSGVVVLSRDLYRDTDRLVVPFNDFDGHPHYLQARAIDPSYKGRAKWSGPANPEGAAWGKYGWFPGDLGWSEILVTEGPGDGLTSVGAGYDTLLIRGASMGLADDVLAELATRFPDRTFVLAGDPDKGGEQFNRIVGERLTSVGLRAVVLQLPGVDVSDWRKQDPDAFYPAFTEAITSAPAWEPEEEPSAPATPEPSAAEDTADHTEVGNAKRILARMQGRVRYTSSLGFLVWNGSAWEEDYRDRVKTEAISVAEALMEEARAMPRGESGSPADKARNAAIRWAHDSQRANGLRGAVEVLKNLPGVRVASQDLDSHPHLLAVGNGTVNLRTGELRESDPKDLLTKSLSVNYVPDAPAARWEQFLTEVFPESPGTRTFLQRLVGYGITGENAEQCFVLLHGHGANGKSVFTSALYDVFSPITANTGVETFLTSESPTSGGGPSSDIAALRGARLALTSESEHGARLAEARLKRLTGGDPVQARHLYREMFTFTPTFLLFMSTNALPEIRGDDDGIWRRIKRLEWAQKFNGARRDTSLPAKLKREREGILVWAVRGAVAWYADHDAHKANALAEPREVAELTEQYREDSDKLSGFFPGLIVADEDAWISRGDLYQRYQQWAESEGASQSQMWRNTTLYAHFASLDGIRSSKRKNDRGFNGLRPARPSELSSDDERAQDGALIPLTDDEDSAPSLDPFTP